MSALSSSMSSADFKDPGNSSTIDTELELRRAFQIWHGFLSTAELIKFFLTTNKQYTKQSMNMIKYVSCIRVKNFDVEDAAGAECNKSRELRQVLKFCKTYNLFHQIRKISIDRMFNGKEELVMFGNATSLCVHQFDYGVEKTVVDWIMSQLDKLRELKLGIMMFDSIPLGENPSSTITNLTLHWMPRMTRLRRVVAFEKLRYLFIGQCMIPSDDIITFLRQHCRTIEHVTIQMNMQIESLDLRGLKLPKLNSLNIFYCSKLKLICIDNCPNLVSFVVKQCMNVEELVISDISPLLTELYLSYLPQLKKLTLPSERQNIMVHVDGCCQGV